ncbi:GH32 C-terminal domain-containing protein [Neobacillus cucumis]|uniref:GH32 C-terminal domain-containing protein n=1 Tax=Neobacillus cucumis TaxID=1740721 RepID=UPI0018DF54DC|nr:GH32 C-terminal domain-containing protein [Neobacillus cucumis]MBI0578649.1 GH32 C-terminal domain-containing protein [Neobacillus cucumis]
MKPNLIKWTSVILSIVLITSSLGMIFVHPAKGNAAESNEMGEGSTIFKNVAKANTNLTDWQIRGKGTLEDTEQGLLLTSEPKENVMAISGVTSEDFFYEADVKIMDKNADATLVFRSSEDGWDSYMLQIVPNAGIIRLRDARDERELKEECQVKVQEGGIYHLKVKVVNDNIKVYWENKYAPIIDVKNSTYKKGFLGLNVWDGAALFQNVKVSELSTNLGPSLYKEGSWEPAIKGLKGIVIDGVKAKQVFNKSASDFVLEGNVSFDQNSSEAALLFRTNDQGTTGYQAALIKEGSTVKAQLKKVDGTVLKTSDRSYKTQEGTKHHLEIITNGNQIELYVDGYSEAAIKAVDRSYSTGFAGFTITSGSAYFQDIYLVPASNYYNEKYRPDYHYTPARGSVSDPNGLVYFEGEYHLFHQDGGTWAHAVSNDMVHWKGLPIALPWNDNGHVWSGSAVADTTNASGLFNNSGGKGLIAYYTSFNPDRPNGNQRIGLAYSTDQGRTWEYSTEHPIVIENPGKNGEDPGGWDFRDPKVVRDDANNRWVMVVSGGDHIRFFTSTNLIDWKLTDNFGYGNYVRGGVWECPDLFELQVDGTKEKKWVLMISTGANPKTQGSDAEYFIGDLTSEGKYINDNPAGKVLKTDYGKEFYASTSFSDMPDNRRVMMAWMTNWDYPFAFPTTGWKGELTIPREVRLVKTDDGIRLAQSPIKELQTIRSTIFQTENKVVNPSNSSNLLKGISSGAFEIEAEIEIPSSNELTEFGLQVREGADQKTVVGYKPADNQIFVDRAKSGETDFSSLFSTLHEAPLKPENKRIKMNIFVDDSSIEVFANDGKVVLSDVIFPDPSRSSMNFYTKGGEVKVISLKVHPLENIWNQKADEETSIVMDTNQREMNIGDNLNLFASVENGKGKGTQPIKWTSSDSNVVKVDSSTNSKAVIKAVSKGESVITASTPDGKASTSVVVRVYDGEFFTNLTGWKPDLSASQWTITESGIRGAYTSDANYIAKETAGNFTYEAEMMLGPNGGAGSILFRASEDGRSGYYFNLDPNMKAFRLFYKIDGGFEDRMVIAKVPAFIQPGRTYKVKIEAKGPHIQIYVDDQKIIDLQDGTFAEGHFGLNVFGGQATYQNVNVSNLSEAKLTVTSFTNLSTGKAIYTAMSQNGEPVTVADTDKATKWILIPTGDEYGSYSIRTEGGKALDLDTGQNKIQLYTYLGYNNQRWIITKNDNGTVRITSVHNGRAIEISKEGILKLNDVNPDSERQQWTLLSDL